MSTWKYDLNSDGNQVKGDDSSYKPVQNSDQAQNVDYAESEIEYVTMERAEVMETEVSDENDDQWDAKSIRVMLNLYLQNAEKFRNPKMRKKILWTDISAALNKTPDCCDKKFRNLKQTYIRLLKKKMTSGGGKIRWPYYDLFDAIYCANGEYQPEIQTKLHDNSNESIVAKALLSINTASNIAADIHDNSKSFISTEEDKKTRRKRFAELRKVTLEMRDRQRTVEEKLDRLINIVEESNNIQKERNELFQQFLEKLNHT